MYKMNATAINDASRAFVLICCSHHCSIAIRRLSAKEEKSTP